MESNQPLRIFSPSLSPFELPVQSLRRVPFPRRTTFGWDNAPPIPLRIRRTDLLCNASCREIAFFGAVPASIPGIRYFRVAYNHSTALTTRIAARSTPSVFNVGVRPMPTPCRSFYRVTSLNLIPDSTSIGDWPPSHRLRYIVSHRRCMVGKVGLEPTSHGL